MEDKLPTGSTQRYGSVKRTLFAWLAPELRRTAAVLFAVQFVRGAVLISFLPIFGKNALAHSLETIGAAITALFLSDTCLKLAIGYLLDRFSPGAVVRVGLIASLAGVAAMGAADRPWLFIVAAAVYGAGVSPIWIVCLTRVRREKRATQMGMLYTIWLVGLGAGPVATNALLEVNYTWTYALLVACCALNWLLAHGLAAERIGDGLVVPFREQWRMMRQRLQDTKPLLPGMVLQAATAGMLLPILPSFAEVQLGLTPSQYSLLLLIGGGCTALGLVPMGRLADRLGQRRFLTAGFFGFGVALYALTLHPSVPLAMVCALALGLCYSAVLPAWNALLAAYIPPAQRGLGWGIFSTVEGVGGVFGPYFGGLIATLWGEGFLVGLAGVIFGAIGILYLILPLRTQGGDNPAATVKE